MNSKPPSIDSRPPKFSGPPKGFLKKKGPPPPVPKGDSPTPRQFGKMPNEFPKKMPVIPTGIPGSIAKQPPTVSPRLGTNTPKFPTVKKPEGVEQEVVKRNSFPDVTQTLIDLKEDSMSESTEEENMEKKKVCAS